jgi:hypothetical protein
MRRLRRALLLLALSLAVTLTVTVFRVLNALGMFAGIEAHLPGPCSAIAVVGGIKDLQIDRGGRLLFAALTGRGQDGIYAMALDHPENGFTRLTGSPANFHPTSLSVFRADKGALALMAVDRPKGQEPAITIFDVRVSKGSLALIEKARVAGGLLVDPAAVAAAGPDQFYVTNASTSVTGLGRILETVVLLPRGNVVFFDGNLLRIVADGLNSPRGVQISDDGTHLYVTAATGRTLHAFERNSLSGSLNETSALVVGPGLGSVSRDESGQLWIAAQPKLLEQYLYGSSKRLASQVFKVSLLQGTPQSAEIVYSDTGSRVSAASAGVVMDGNLYIGGPNDSHLLRCRMARL